ncbi:arginine decarboxylase [Bacillus sp. FJAT-27225]|uniref:aminotransferase class I/II-fold pyridoxal phosphate-dependent enzyme n=1 Tax=Bacillus sp. FJAT-27225 TaxID=1743144 RepID=UPI00080C2AAD|nr:aminotransferase class I/II-fold pyridoxal phosphate-dependent enzyme [Bacillus sp. FJAT-27225]OCA80654.1 arginine decarboxylase [Bacillus sp. FJAT-27225]
MDQSKTPLYTALHLHSIKKPVSYHVPGHKYGFVPTLATENYFSGIMKIDATELPELDDLHSPEGVILLAEQLLAEVHNVRKSFFLVNGSTVGNLAMILAVCKENDRILVQRNCHKSVMNAIQLAKARPLFIEPDYISSWKVAGGVNYRAVKQAIDQFPDAKGIVLTYPNYYGMADSIEDIVEAAHEKGIPVLVDEAHGAHFTAGSSFPDSACSQGADVVVQSAHKTLPALTMGSYLHVNSSLVSVEKIKEQLQILQSSSPSYPIMASLDIARSYLASYNQSDIEYLTGQVTSFREKLGRIKQIKVLDYPGKGDPLKVTIQSACQLTGFELQEKLVKAGIYTELADSHNVLFVLPLLKKDMVYPFDDTVKKLEAILSEFECMLNEPDATVVSANGYSELALTYKEMQERPFFPAPILEATGRVSAETIIPYPPGIPLVIKGERLQWDTIKRLMELRQKGARFQGGIHLDEGKILVFV